MTNLCIRGQEVWWRILQGRGQDAWWRIYVFLYKSVARGPDEESVYHLQVRDKEASGRKHWTYKTLIFRLSLPTNIQTLMFYRSNLNSRCVKHCLQSFELQVQPQPGHIVEIDHEISHLMRLWYFSSSVNSFFKRCMRSHPVGLDVWFWVGPFAYFHASCVWTARLWLAWAFVSRLCDKYHNLMSWFKYFLQPSHLLQIQEYRRKYVY